RVDRQDGRDLVRVRLHGLGREHRPVDVLRAMQLGLRSGDQRRIAVTDADHDRAAGTVEVAPPVRVDDPRALGADRRREGAGHHPGEHVVAHARTLQIRERALAIRVLVAEPFLEARAAFTAERTDLVGPVGLLLVVRRGEPETLVVLGLLGTAHFVYTPE